MADEVVHDLVALAPYTAYMKTDKKYKIRTQPLPEAKGGVDVNAIITAAHIRCCRDRAIVEEEIGKRGVSSPGQTGPAPSS